MYIAFYMGNKMVSFSMGSARNGDIGENALYTMAKRETPIGFPLLGV
jgi:hypothetical protein